MVSLEDRAAYSLRVNESPKVAAFNNLLLNHNIASPPKQELNESEEIYFGLLCSIHANDKNLFIKYYSKKSKSNPSKESPSPFVNDDFLIFSLIIGITKFGLDKSWIKNIISIRSQNGITITLQNILNENYYSSDNFYEIVLMYFQLSNPVLISDDLLNNAFKRLSENTVLFDSKSDFQILCAIRAYDLIILMKVAPDGSELNLLKGFNAKFIRRTRLFSWIFQLLILVCFLYWLLRLPVYSPKSVEWINRYGYVFTVLGALGFTFLSNQFTFIKQICHELPIQIFVD